MNIKRVNFCYTIDFQIYFLDLLGILAFRLLNSLVTSLVCWPVLLHVKEIELPPPPKKGKSSLSVSSPAVASAAMPTLQTGTNMSAGSLTVGSGTVDSRLTSGGNFPEHMVGTPHSAVSTPLIVPSNASTSSTSKMAQIGSSVSITSTPVQSAAKLPTSNIMGMSQPTKVISSEFLFLNYSYGLVLI